MSSRVSREDRCEISRRLQRKQNTKHHCWLEGLRKSSEPLFSKDHKSPFTRQAILVDINIFCSIFLILIYLIPLRCKLTPYKLLQQSRSCSFTTAPPQVMFPSLQGFNTHLTQSHMCCNTAGKATSTELWQNNADVDPQRLPVLHNATRDTSLCPLHFLPSKWHLFLHDVHLIAPESSVWSEMKDEGASSTGHNSEV